VCEPENRSVAGELERRWEEALKHQQQLEDDFARWQRTAPGRLTAEEERAIRALAADLPAVWHATTTTPAERQRIARLLIEQASVTVDKPSERVDLEIHWMGGLVDTHILARPVKRYGLQTDYPRLVERLRVLGAKGCSAAEAAERLNAEGFWPPKRASRFSAEMVRRLLWHLGLARRAPHGRLAGLGRDEYRPLSLARRLEVTRDTVRRWLRAGGLTAWRDAQGHHVTWADASELWRLGELYSLPRNWATERRLAELKKLKPRPQR
jgi:excisionase family DNA binding protein